MDTERLLILAGGYGYLVLAISSLSQRFRRWLDPGLGLLSAVLAAAIALRWQRLGHGPFINLYEILLSNLFSLGGLYLLIRTWRPQVRIADSVVAGVLALLGLWLVQVPALDSHLPPTYETPWLWLHLITGKLFLAFALVAAGLGGVIIGRALVTHPHEETEKIQVQAWRWLGVALVFHSMMLVAGAVWAQDAWGRYWAWDPLETSAFLTWLAMAFALHARSAWRPGQLVTALLFWGVFVLAFLTFFGVPFISQAPHQGAI